MDADIKLLQTMKISSGCHVAAAGEQEPVQIKLISAHFHCAGGGMVSHWKSVSVCGSLFPPEVFEILKMSIESNLVCHKQNRG